MNWSFWKNKEIAHATEFNDMKSQMSSIQEQVSLLDQQLQKLTRLEYKTGKSLEGKIEDVTLIIKEQQEKSASLDYQVIDRLIQQIDEMDMVYASLSSEPQWSELIEKWTTSLVDSLATFGIHQCIQAGEMFDPTLAEAVKTISSQEGNSQLLVPYQIVEVFRRGFIGSNKQIIRKAQVVTVEEGI
jgi:molecular chaperone GrpE (heat shock protein)